MRPDRKLHEAALSALVGMAILLAAGCTLNRTESADKSALHPGSEGNPITVSSALVEAIEVPLVTEATGSFVAEESSNVAPLTSGRVTETPVDVGARVEKGQIIVRLDVSDATLRLEQARASAEQADATLRQAQAKIGFDGGRFKAEEVPEVQSARASYDSALADSRMADADAARYENLLKTGDISRSNYERQVTQAETAKAKASTSLKQYEAALNNARQNYQAIASAQASLAAARSQLAQAQKALDDTIVRAPISGYVTERQVAVGEYVAPSSKIVTMVRVNPIKLQLQIPGADAERVGVGMKVLARVENYGTREFEGRITALNPALDPNSRSLMAESRFDNPGNELRPGMFATARVILPGMEKAFVLPRDAVLVDQSLNSSEVFVVDGGKAHVRVVQIGGAARAGMVRILSGVAPGDTVATSRLQQLYDGAAVKPEQRR
jgi:multidrug efflux pump subunit AcrA (membrane-fusion protein)